jgi:hypothetical protein
MERTFIDHCAGINLKSALRNLKSAILVGAMLLALSSPVNAQQQAKIPKIGWLSPSSAASSTTIEPFLREVGHERTGANYWF